MATQNQRDNILKKAYELWESEGRQSGRDMEHWLRAEMLISKKTKPSARSRKAASKAKPATKAKAKSSAKAKSKPAAKTKSKPTAKLK
ncbi:MAG: DUF2934 domain-containing protein [Magnetovibrio sp.]|nr:DUF2934 domain-containing protein [Magnetovibrio sp.]